MVVVVGSSGVIMTWYLNPSYSQVVPYMCTWLECAGEVYFYITSTYRRYTCLHAMRRAQFAMGLCVDLGVCTYRPRGVNLYKDKLESPVTSVCQSARLSRGCLSRLDG